MAEVKWIKLSTDLFSNRKIKQIRKLPEGDAIVGVWVQILCLAGQINDNGMVYFSKDIPYTEEMLAVEFDRPVNIIKMALATFENFKMIEVVDNILLVSNWEKYQSTSKLEKIREQNRLRQQRFRDKQKLLADNNVTDNVTVTLRNATDIDIDKDIDKDIDIEKNKTIPYQEIADLYNSICKSYPRLTKLSDARKKAIKARLNTYTLDDFKTLFQMAEESDFLKGKNDRNWSATFDWLIKDSNMAKVLDGNYKNSANQPTKPKPTNKFNQFPQREYTSQQMSDIERVLINKGLED